MRYDTQEDKEDAEMRQAVAESQRIERGIDAYDEMKNPVYPGLLPISKDGLHQRGNPRSRYYEGI